MGTHPTVYIVDDDENVRESLRALIESADFRVKTFASGEAFLDQYASSTRGCLLLDLCMNGMSGLDVQQKLNEDGSGLPVIVMTADGNVAACRSAFKLGACDFVEKPADGRQLIESIRKALAENFRNQLPHRAEPDSMGHPAKLTKRETDVVNLIVQGKSQKQIAMEFQISVQTVAKHRAKALSKLDVANDVELTKLILSHGL